MSDQRPTPTPCPSGARIEATRRYPAQHQQALEARSFVVSAVAGWCEAEVFARIVVLTDQLVSHAVTHAGGEFSVSVLTVVDVCRIEVTDPTPDRARDERRSSDGDHRVALLLHRLASRWGVALVSATPALPKGKTVWFEVVRAPRVNTRQAPGRPAQRRAA